MRIQLGCLHLISALGYKHVIQQIRPIQFSILYSFKRQLCLANIFPSLIHINKKPCLRDLIKYCEMVILCKLFQSPDLLGWYNRTCSCQQHLKIFPHFKKAVAVCCGLVNPVQISHVSSYHLLTSPVHTWLTHYFLF